VRCAGLVMMYPTFAVRRIRSSPTMTGAATSFSKRWAKASALLGVGAALPRMIRIHRHRAWRPSHPLPVRREDRTAPSVSAAT